MLERQLKEIYKSKLLKICVLSKRIPPQKQKELLVDEVVMLKRILQLKAVGKNVNLEETIGEYERSKVPPTLFEPNGSMRHGCKTGWLKTGLKETHLRLDEKLLESDKCTVLGVDVFHSAASVS